MMSPVFPKMVEAAVEVLPLGAAQAEKDFLDEVSKRFGILCMSQVRNSILMWGHYCGKHFGLVIGFDKSVAVFRQGKGLKPVNYVKSRVGFDACWEIGSAELIKYEENVILAKSDEWAYEEEFRQFFALSSPMLIKKQLDDGTPGHFLPLPPETIASVTLGPKCCSELEKEVREILLKPCFTHVQLDRAVLNKNDFAIEFKPLELKP